MNQIRIGKHKHTVIMMIQAAFLYFWAVNLRGTDSYYSVYLLIAVASCFAMQKNYGYAPEMAKSTVISTVVFAGVFSVAVVLANYTLFIPWTAILSLFNAGCTFVGGMVAFGHILYYLVGNLPFAVSDEDRNRPVWVFFGALSVTALCYLFFHSYPGLLGTDSFATIRQIQSNAYNNTMPFWHTLTVELFFNLGMAVFNDINSAVALFHVAQILFMSACFAYAVMTLYQIGVPWVVLGCVFAVYTILPYHVAYSVTLWKDILFGGAALLTVTALYRILRGIGKNTVVNEIVFVIGSTGLSLWRTNGWYAFAATALVMVILLRKKHKRLLAIMGGVLLVCWILINPLLSILNVPSTDFVEAFGIPFQQIARVVAEERPLTVEETHMLSQIFDLEQVKEKYDPQTVDPVKFEAFRRGNREFLKTNMAEYTKLWLKLGVRYPDVYLQAWVEATKGYWNGGYEYWIYMYHMDENDMGFAQTGSNNLIGNAFRAMYRYLEKPEILQPLYSIGLHVWFVAICCFVNIQRGREEFLITIPILVIVAGLLVGTPVFAEFRYAYPVFTTVPLITCVTIFERTQTKK